jgi:chromosome segregation ATPase
MTWWVWLVLVLGIYLVLCIAPWIALQIASGRLRRRGTFATDVLPRIERLVDTERIQTGFWPEQPRAGRYEEIDRSALEQLGALRIDLAQINQEADAVAAYAPPELSPWQVLVLGAWRALSSKSRAFGEWRRLDAHLDVAGRRAISLVEQQSQSEAVPDRMQADLSELRAEVRRLYALWEGEIQAGTREIQALGDGLALVDNAMGSSTESVRSAAAGDEPGSIVRADQQLAMAKETIRQAEQELTAIHDSRVQARAGLERVQASVAGVDAMWEVLQGMGAKDPSVAARVAEFGQQATALKAALAQATPAAYEQAAADAYRLEGLGTTVTGELAALKGTIGKSTASAREDSALLERAQAALAESMSAMPEVALDESSREIAEAQDIIAQSGSLLHQGTWHGYQTAASLLEQARATLDTALAGMESTRTAVRALSVQRGQVNDEARLALRERANALAQNWAVYGRHWHPLRQQAYAAALQSLDAADAAWSALPEDYVRVGALDQTRLADAQGGMQTVTDRLREVRQGIETLEAELGHVESLRQELEAGLATLDGTTVPALAARRETMLPELLERYEAWLVDYQVQRVALSDPARIDYERAVGQWLPAVTGEAQGILTAYDGDLAHYGKLLEDARRRLEKSWQRLERLDPTSKPLPQEDVTQLTAGYSTWMATGEAETANPAVLSTLVTREAGDLERRIEAARRQISEGRQSLNGLERQFDQVGQALQKTRSTLRSLEQDSQWHQITWVLGSGEEAWERALAAQASARETESLDLAVNEMRRAVNLGQEAQQVYTGTEQQLRSALDRLNREFRSATADLDRAQRRAAQLRQKGPSEELDALDESIASAMSLVSMAQNAGTFDDALRHLRESQEVLARA